jgi:hypothetical protein
LFIPVANSHPAGDHPGHFFKYKSNHMEKETKFEQLPAWIQTIIVIGIALLLCTADNWF